MTILYIYDGSGNIIALMDDSGTKVVEYTYDSWGNQTISGSMKDTLGKANPFRYRSYTFDEETGYYYCTSRYYDPNMQRFINADALVIPSDIRGLNVYAYCFNDPVGYIDASGFEPGKGYNSIDKAVVGWSDYLDSIRGDGSDQISPDYPHEVGSIIYTDNKGKYYYTEIRATGVKVGESRTWDSSAAHNPIGVNPNSENNLGKNVGSLNNTMNALNFKGLYREAFIHSHEPAGSPILNKLSTADQKVGNRTPVYMKAPNGDLLMTKGGNAYMWNGKKFELQPDYIFAPADKGVNAGSLGSGTSSSGPTVTMGSNGHMSLGGLAFAGFVPLFYIPEPVVIPTYNTAVKYRGSTGFRPVTEYIYY